MDYYPIRNLESKKPRRKDASMNKRIELMRDGKSARKLFVVDIENAVGAGIIDKGSCRRAMERIYHAHKPKDGDLTIVGVSHTENFIAVKSWNASIRVVGQWGHNGADLALESVLENENVENRFGEIVIVSGDGLFAKQATRLRSIGVKVTVDARAAQLSRSLAFSCSAVRLAPSALAA